MAWTWFHRLGSPPYIYGLAARLTPWFGWAAAALIVGGLYGGLVLAPPDYQQGDDFRIIYVHVPSAWMSLMVYTTMAISAGVGLIWRIKVAHAIAASLRAHRCLLHVRGPRHRLVVGLPDVGHVLGVGSTPDIRAHTAVPVSGLHGLAVGDGRHATLPIGRVRFWP